MDINNYVDEKYRVVGWELDTFEQYAKVIKEHPNAAERYADFIIELVEEIKASKWSSKRLKPIYRGEFE